MNFDGAVRNNGAAIGFLIRNHEVAIFLAGGKRAISYAKLVGAWHELCIHICHYNPQEVSLQGDSTVVVAWINCY